VDVLRVVGSYISWKRTDGGEFNGQRIIFTRNTQKPFSRKMILEKTVSVMYKQNIHP
jgi:hypothetical protein